MSLRTRLALTLCALIVLLISSMSYFLYHRSAAVLNQEATDYMAAQLERAKENIDLLLEITRLETVNLSRDQRVRSFLEGRVDTASMNRYLRNLMAARNQSEKRYMDFFILNLEGRITTATRPDFLNLDLYTREYYQESLRTGETVTSDILVSRSDGSLIIITVSPIYSPDGALLAHAGIAIYAEYLSKIVKTFELGETGYYMILDSQNRVLSHPDVSLIATASDIEIPAALEMTEAPSPGDVVSGGGRTQTGAGPGTVTVRSEADRQLMMFSRMESNRWILIASMPERELQGKSIRLLSDVVFIGLGAAVLAILAASYISGKISAPIVAITASIERASQSSQRLSQSVADARRSLGSGDGGAAGIAAGVAAGEGVFEGDLHDISPRLSRSDRAPEEVKNLSGSYLNFRMAFGALLKTFSLKNEELLSQSVALSKAIETQSRQTAQFVSVLSHDLRTSLTLVKGYAKALASGLVSEEETRQKFLQGILTGAEEVELITTDILDSAYEAQALPKLHLEFIEAHAFAGKLYENSERLVLEAGGRFEGIFQVPRGPQLRIDPVKVTRVWNNLLYNGLKYSAAGGRIHVAMTAVDGAVRFLIRDEGIGISEEDQAKIFDMFFCGHHDRKQGYGLGLFIAKSFLQAHQAELRFESELGWGTTFWFDLPLEQMAV